MRRLRRPFILVEAIIGVLLFAAMLTFFFTAQSNAVGVLRAFRYKVETEQTFDAAFAAAIETFAKKNISLGLFQADHGQLPVAYTAKKGWVVQYTYTIQKTEKKSPPQTYLGFITISITDPGKTTTEKKYPVCIYHEDHPSA